MAVKQTVIKSIFVNLLFLIGVILVIVGFVGGTSTIVKLFVFDKYPLQSYEEARCEINKGRPALPPAEMPLNVEDTTRSEEQTQKCLISLEKDRKLKLVEDTTRAFSFTVSGLVLAFAFRKFIFDKNKDG